MTPGTVHSQPNLFKMHANHTNQFIKYMYVLFIMRTVHGYDKHGILPPRGVALDKLTSTRAPLYVTLFQIKTGRITAFVNEGCDKHVHDEHTLLGRCTIETNIELINFTSYMNENIRLFCMYIMTGERQCVSSIDYDCSVIWYNLFSHYG